MYQLPLPKEWTMEELYLDYGMFSDTYIFAAYTPYGIKLMDAEYCRRIIAGEDCSEEIKKNPHLHPVIKENLLHNIEIRRE